MERPVPRRLAIWLAPSLLLLLAACGTNPGGGGDTLATYGAVRDHVDGITLELESLAETIAADETTATAVTAVTLAIGAYPLETGSADLTRGTFRYDPMADGMYGYTREADDASGAYDLEIIGNIDDTDVRVLVDWDRDGTPTKHHDIGGSSVEVPASVSIAVVDGVNEIGDIDLDAAISTYDIAGCPDGGLRVEELDVRGDLGAFDATVALGTGSTSSLDVTFGYGAYGLGVGFEVDVDAAAPVACRPADADMPTRVAASVDLTRPSGTVGVEASADDITWQNGNPTGLNVSGALSSDGTVAATVAGSVQIDPDTGETTDDIVVHFADSDLTLDKIIEEFSEVE